MAGDPREVIADRGGIWPLPFERAERVLLTTQAKFDRRAIPPLWLWRMLRPEDGPGATDQDETLWESTLLERRYADPVPVHLYVDWTPEKKGKKKATVETAGTVPIGWSRAEARRVGRLVGSADDAEGMVTDQVREDLIFIPRAGDLFLARGRYYGVTQLAPEWLGATDVITAWKGTAAMLRDDASSPGLASIPKPPSLKPPVPAGIEWRQ
jgi:hypothetical protein